MGKISSTQIVNTIDNSQKANFMGVDVGPEVTLDDVIVTVRGGDMKTAHETGTWFHPKLAITFARWLSDEFENLVR